VPAFIENKLKKEYGEKSPIVYATMNKLGYMKGNKETKKGREVEREHQIKAIKHNIT
jgi:hypothetical protein